MNDNCELCYAATRVLPNHDTFIHRVCMCGATMIKHNRMHPHKIGFRSNLDTLLVPCEGFMRLEVKQVVL